MATLYCTTGANTFFLKTDPTYNYGLDDDRVAGLGGADLIGTGPGDDIIDGGEGNDSLYDGDGDDTVTAGPGDDWVNVDAGNDIYYGGSGVDRIVFNFIHFGAGGAIEDNFSDVTVNLASTALQDFGELGLDRIYGFENASGTFGHDMISGTASVNVLDGFGGNDTLKGLAGNDTLDGGFGRDTLIGGLAPIQ